MRGNVRVHQRKIVAQRRKRLAILVSGFVLGLATVVGSIAFLSHAEFLRITDIRVTGNSRLSETYVRAMVEGLLDAKYLGMFSKRALFLYPHDAIEVTLAVMPVMKSVHVESEGLRSLVIEIEEREEVARLCDGGQGVFDTCFALDEEGFAFSPSDDALMVAYRNPVLVPAIGGSFLTPHDFKALEFFVRELSSLDVDPREIVIGEAGYVRVFLGGGGHLVVNSLDDLSLVLSNLSLVLNDRAVASSSAGFLSRLDYMRLDAGNKVFYRLR
jgi:hypothetical protein